MASRDVRDIMDLPKGELPPPPSKKKAIEKKKSAPKRGLEKEIAGLKGDRDAPVEITIEPQYKAKRKLEGPVRHWRYESFVNGARTDGLVLRHLKRTNKLARQTLPPPNNDSAEPEIDQENHDSDGSEEPAHNYAFEKYNIDVKYPKYDAAQYETHLRSEDWSKEETDYLIGLYREYFGKWAIIWDRFEFAPSSHHTAMEVDSSTPPPEPKSRSMEDLKGRYFEVARTVMTLDTPLNRMTSAEFADHEKMTKWNSQHERDRKKIAEAMLTRNKDDLREESQLLVELQRITREQARFEEDVRNLRERLDMSLTKDRPDQQNYMSSAGMGQLMQSMMAHDGRRSLGRSGRSLGSAVVSSPITGNNQGGPSSATQKKTPGKAGLSSHRRLLPQAELRFGVSTHDRLTSGVTFRTDKIAKLRQAKSGVQTQKIANLLNELQIPELLQTPTVAVCTAMEKLIVQVNLLLETRRIKEKEEGEIRVALAQQEENEKGEKGEKGEKAEKAESGVNASAQSEQKTQDKSQNDTADVEMADAQEDDDIADEEDQDPDGAEDEGPEDEGGEEDEAGVEVTEDVEELDADGEHDEDAEGVDDDDNIVQGEEEDDGVEVEVEEEEEDEDEDEEEEEEEEEEEAEEEDDDDDDDDGNDGENSKLDSTPVKTEPGDGHEESTASTPARSGQQSRNSKRSLSVASVVSSSGTGTSIRVNPKRNKGAMRS